MIHVSLILEMSATTETITIANFKGGVGKTTTSVLFTYLLAKKHLKTLLIDFDPQANASEIMKRSFITYDDTRQITFANGIKQQNLSKSIVYINRYLSILPSNWNLALLPDILEKYDKSQRPLFLKHLLRPVKKSYDYVIIDTPPTLSAFTNNAILASDYVIMVMQTQEQSFEDSLKFVEYLKGLVNDYPDAFDLLGIIPYLINKNGVIDNCILKYANKDFGKAMLHEKIYQRARVKRFCKFGIKDQDVWDKRTLKMYDNLLNESLSRIQLLEEYK